MGRPLGPGGKGLFFKVLRFWKKNNKITGRIRHKIRSGDTIVAYPRGGSKQSVMKNSLVPDTIIYNFIKFVCKIILVIDFLKDKIYKQ